MKVLLVLCALVVCASAWTYTHTRGEHNFVMPRNGERSLNDKQAELLKRLSNYDRETLRCPYNAHGCTPYFNGTRVTCTATNFVCHVEEPFAHTLSSNATALSPTDFIYGVAVDDYVMFAVASQRRFTMFENALFAELLEPFKEKRISCTSKVWECRVFPMPFSPYESFSVGYTKATEEQPTVVIARALTLDQAREQGVSAEDYSAVIRSSFDVEFPAKYKQAMSIVHSCHTFTVDELLQLVNIPNISRSDVISREICASIYKSEQNNLN